MALGGNVAAEGSDLRGTLMEAVGALTGAGVRVVRRSRVWRSAAWPDPLEPAFLNAVVLVETAFDPERLLARLHEVESRFGRVRRRPNAARTLDLDLIAYGRRTCADGLLLPHPRAAERLFVMGPLAELCPGWRHPVTGERAADLAIRAPVGRDATPMDDDP